MWWFSIFVYACIPVHFRSDFLPFACLCMWSMHVVCVVCPHSFSPKYPTLSDFLFLFLSRARVLAVPLLPFKYAVFQFMLTKKTNAHLSINFRCPNSVTTCACALVFACALSHLLNSRCSNYGTTKSATKVLWLSRALLRFILA